MMNFILCRSVVARSLLLVLPAWISVAAQQAPNLNEDDGKTIVEIKIEGLRLVPETRVRSNIRMRTGRPFRAQVAQDDVKRLYTLGLFYDAVVATQDRPDGVAVIIRVLERPLVREVVFAGNESISTEKLAEEVDIRAGSSLDLFKVKDGRQRIIDLYQEKGYPFIQVEIASGQLRDDERVVYRIVEGPQTLIDDVYFEGNDTFSDSDLSKHIQTSPPKFIFFGGKYDEDQLENDLDAVRRFYRDRGFFDVEVAKELNYTASRRRMKIAIVVDEGTRYRIGEIRVTGASKYSTNEIQDRLFSKVNDFYDKELTDGDQKQVEAMYGMIGHIVYDEPGYTRVLVQHRFTQEPGVVQLDVAIREGPQYRVGRVEIKGNRITRDKVIRREVRLYPEQLFDSTEFDRTRHRLSELLIFEVDRILGKPRLRPVGDSPTHRDFEVTVEETETGNIIFGAGLTSDNGVLGNISLIERNFDIANWPGGVDDLLSGEAFRGGGQYFAIRAQPGTEINRFDIDFREPYLMDRNLSLGTNLFLFERDRGPYDEGRAGGRVGVGRRFGDRWQANFALRAENVDIDDISLDAPRDVFDVEGNDFLGGGKVTVSYDERDSRWTPSRGFYFETGVEQLFGEETFNELTFNYKKFWTLKEKADGTNKQVLSFRSSLGFIIGDAPIYERLYAGGHGSMRGFAFRGMGPHADDSKFNGQTNPRTGALVRQDDDDEIGGEFLFVNTVEYSYPVLNDDLRLVAFTDFGTLEEEVEIDQFRMSVGFGIRVKIPFFGQVPIALDFGFPIAKDKDDETQIFSFSLGTFF